MTEEQRAAFRRMFSGDRGVASRMAAERAVTAYEAELDRLTAELDRVMPVYEAAQAWVNDHQSQANIIVAVRAAGEIQ